MRSESATQSPEKLGDRDRFILQGLVRRGFPYAATYVIVSVGFDAMSHKAVVSSVYIWTLLASFLGLLLGAGWCEGERIWHRHERELRKSNLKPEMAEDASGNRRQPSRL